MRILLLQDQGEETREKIAFALESTFGAQVTFSGSFKDALSVIGEGGGYDYLISDIRKTSVQDFERFQESVRETHGGGVVGEGKGF